ncbi:MAG: peptidoglycan DD-metalloendopeptidase family protein [Deltaproteobacteria bacterium]
MERKKIDFIVDTALGIFLGIALIAILYNNNLLLRKDSKALNSILHLNSGNRTVTTLYGFDIKNYVFNTNRIKENQIFSSLLYWEGVPYETINKLISNAKGIFDVETIRENSLYTMIRKDSCGQLLSMVYEPDMYSYVVFNFADSVYVKRVFRDVETRLEFAQGEVENTLWNSMTSIGIDISLIDKMEDALASEVDFYHAQKGDKFKLLYERKYINNRPVSIGNLLGAVYLNDEENTAIYFEKDKTKGYYNKKGQPTNKTFLKAPVRFSRITSGFSRSRFHPILHRHKAHHGTDYGAPTGTPIMAVGAGIITERGYGRGNGNYITIKHDNKYTTTYLHMSRFGKGIHRGTRVSQGQVIGYVGSTGLATGPHVCFRMKKNGSPVNHLKERFSSPDPLPKKIRNEFFIVRDSILKLMNEYEVSNARGSEMVNLKTVRQVKA